MRGSAGFTLGSNGTNRQEIAEPSDDPMGSVGVGLKIGMGHVPGMRVDSPVSREFGTRLGARTGLLVALPINFGDGDGLGFDLEPFLFRYTRGVQVADYSSSVIEYGGYVGPAVRFHMKRFYLSLGIGAKFGWIDDDLFEVGMDLFGRVPLTATYYLSDRMGLTFELAVAYGATGVRTRDVDSDLVAGLAGAGATAGALGGASDAVSVQFGSGFAMDSSIGVRFP